ncbi:MAG: BtpA/SgcQ family protein [Candidatus Diapherotrites archaeon]
MEFEAKFDRLFASKPIIGMVHLAGNNKDEKIKRALEELSIYEQEGVDGAIIEDYHGPAEYIYETLKEVQKNNYKIILGVNNLRNPYASFHSKNLGAKFVQFDSVQNKDLNLENYNEFRKVYADMIVLGGIRFKYTLPTGNSLEKDLDEGKLNCDAIVTTGEGTGIETPIKKLKVFKSYLGDFSLIIGAGLNTENAYEQLQIADGAIVGSAFKPNKNTRLPVDKYLVRELIDMVKEVRKNGI